MHSCVHPPVIKVSEEKTQLRKKGVSHGGKFQNIGAKNEIGKLGKGHENDEKHEEKEKQILRGLKRGQILEG